VPDLIQVKPLEIPLLEICWVRSHLHGQCAIARMQWCLSGLACTNEVISATKQHLDRRKVYSQVHYSAEMALDYHRWSSRCGTCWDQPIIISLVHLNIAVLPTMSLDALLWA
jgi:hypothetical protein